MDSSQLDFDKMWNDPIVTNTDPGSILGGNVKGLGNFCCIRVSHALMTAGHTINIESSYYDDNKNYYIIKCDTMETYMQDNFGDPTTLIDEASAAGKTGIIFFKKCGFSDATGHFDLWNGSETAYKSYFDRAQEGIFLWEFSSNQQNPQQAQQDDQQDQQQDQQDQQDQQEDQSGDQQDQQQNQSDDS